MEHLHYPNESVDYRAARNALLDAEIALRREIERVAAMRRALPPGGAVPTDYVFERLGANLMPETVRLSALLAYEGASGLAAPEQVTVAPLVGLIGEQAAMAESIGAAAQAARQDSASRRRAGRRRVPPGGTAAPCA